MKPPRIVVLLVLALGVYIALIGYRGVLLLGQPQWTLKALGVALLAFPLLGVWVVWAELRFGRDMQRLAARLVGTGDGALPRDRTGRVSRAAAEARFAQRRAAVQADPADWTSWFRLALAYDDAGDRRRARVAMRTAIETEARPPVQRG